MALTFAEELDDDRLAWDADLGLVAASMMSFMALDTNRLEEFSAMNFPDPVLSRLLCCSACFCCWISAKVVELGRLWVVPEPDLAVGPTTLAYNWTLDFLNGSDCFSGFVIGFTGLLTLLGHALGPGDWIGRKGLGEGLGTTTSLFGVLLAAAIKAEYC